MGIGGRCSEAIPVRIAPPYVMTATIRAKLALCAVRTICAKLASLGSLVLCNRTSPLESDAAVSLVLVAEAVRLPIAYLKGRGHVHVASGAVVVGERLHVFSHAAHIGCLPRWRSAT